VEDRKFQVGDIVQRTSQFSPSYRVGTKPFEVREIRVPAGVNEDYIIDVYGQEHWPGMLTLVKTAEPDTNAVSPAHYRFGDAQVIDITRHLDFLSGSAIKYIARAGRKGDRLTDLKKARQFVDWLIEDAEKANRNGSDA
jgi:hypothetical protein